MEKENLMKKMLVILCSLFSITIFACRDENSPSNSKSSSSSSYSKKSSNSTSSSSSSYSTDQRMSFEEIFTANIIRGVFQRVREPANVYGFGLSPLNTNHSVDWNVQKDGRKHEERFSLFSSSSSSSRANSFRNNSFSPSSSYSCGSSGSDTSNFAYKAYKSPSGIDLGLTSFSSSCTSSFSSSYPMRGGLAGEVHGYITPNQHTNQGFLSKPKQLCPKVKNNYDAKGKITNVQGDGRYTIDGKVSTSVESSCYKLNDLKKKGIPTAMCYQSRQNTYELLNSEFPHIPTFGFAAPFGHNVRSKSFLVGVGDSLGSLSRSISSFPSISLGRFPKVDISKIVDKSYLLLRSPSPLLGLTNLTSCFVSSSFPIRYNMVGDGLDDYDDLPLLTNDSYNDHLDNGSYNGLDLNIRPGLPILAGLPLNLSVELLKSDASISGQHNKPLLSSSSMSSSGSKNSGSSSTSSCPSVSLSLTTISPSISSSRSLGSNTPTNGLFLNFVLDGIKSFLGSSTSSTSSSSSSSSMSSSGANTSINGQTSPPRYGPILDYIRRRFHSESSSNSTSSSSSSYSSSSPSSNISNRIYGQFGESFFSRLRKEVPCSPFFALQPSSTSLFPSSSSVSSLRSNTFDNESFYVLGLNLLYLDRFFPNGISSSSSSFSSSSPTSTSFFPLSSSSSSLILNCNTSLFDNPLATFLPFPLMPSNSFSPGFSIYDYMYNSLLRKMRDDRNYRFFPKGNGTWQSIQYSPSDLCWEKAPQKTPPISASSSTSFFTSDSLIDPAQVKAACGNLERLSIVKTIVMVRDKLKPFLNESNPSKNIGITGTLTIGNVTVFTLENACFKYKYGKIIPISIKDGTYRVTIGKDSKKFKDGCFLRLEDLNGRTDIFIHAGEVPDSSDGCILVSPGDLTKLMNVANDFEKRGYGLCIVIRSENEVKKRIADVSPAKRRELANGYTELHKGSRVTNEDLPGGSNRSNGHGNTNSAGSSTPQGNNSSSGGSSDATQGTPPQGILRGGSYSVDPKDNDNKKVSRQDNRQNNNAPMTLKVPCFDDNRYDARYYEWDPEENRYVYNPDKCKDNKDDDDLTSTSDESESLMTHTSNEAAKWDIVIPHIIIDPSPGDDKTAENQDNKHDTNPPNITSKSLAVSVLDDANKSNKVTLNVNKNININIGYDIYRKDVAQSSDTKHSNIKNAFPASFYPTGGNTIDDRLDIKNGQTPPFRGDAKPNKEIVVR